jgi:uncharacterized iron-regulated membrane protein
MAKSLLAILAATVTMVIIYTIAAAIAGNAATGFNPAETASHTRIAEFSATVKRLAAERAEVPSACGDLKVAEKRNCSTDTRATRQRAADTAGPPNGGIRLITGHVAPTATRMHQIDWALYRAHRQIPDNQPR